MKALDLINKKFGKWIVLQKTEKRTKNGQVLWKCKCECGNVRNVSGSNLKNGGSTQCKSCQVSQSNKTHNLAYHPLYYVWKNIKNRCNNPKSKLYKWYGQRGINLCKEWTISFKDFYDWCMKNGYDKTLELDRINNDKGYSPANCRYIDRKTNVRNSRVYKGITP